MARRVFDPDKHCGAKNRQGEQCTRGKGAGTDHPHFGRCSSHGGKSQSHNVAAMREAATKLAHTLTTPIEGDPKDFILQQIHQRAGAANWWAARVAELAPGSDAKSLLAGVRGIVTTVSDATGGPQAGHAESKVTEVGPLLHLALDEWQKAQHALETLCVQAVKLGLDERRVKLAEEQAAQAAEGFRWLVGEARLRLDLNEVEAGVLTDLVAEMMTRLMALESGVKVKA